MKPEGYAGHRIMDVVRMIGITVESQKVTCKVPEGRMKIIRMEWRAEQRTGKGWKDHRME